MRLALAACAVFLCASCVKRIAPSAGGARTVGSGVPQRFGSPQNLPRDASITWDFGDGTPQQSGPEAVHAFPRAGNFTVTETLRAGGDVRTDSARITVLRRSVPMAVPADVRGVFLAQQPWTRAKAARAAARRIGLGDFFDETVGAVNDAVGFDTTDAQAVAENGIDPDEGVALYTVPQDPEALVLCIGISDLPRAEAALRKLLTAGAEPFALTETKLPGGGRAVVGTAAQGTLRVGYLERFGYLYLRARGGTDPLLALASAAAVPEAGGLERDHGYQTALKQVGAGDALFYSAASRDGAGEDRRSFLSGQLGASAFSVGLGKDGLQLRLFGQPRNLHGQALHELVHPPHGPPRPARAPPRRPRRLLKAAGRAAADLDRAAPRARPRRRAAPRPRAGVPGRGARGILPAALHRQRRARRARGRGLAVGGLPRGAGVLAGQVDVHRRRRGAPGEGRGAAIASRQVGSRRAAAARGPRRCAVEAVGVPSSRAAARLALRGAGRRGAARGAGSSRSRSSGASGQGEEASEGAPPTPAGADARAARPAGRGAARRSGCAHAGGGARLGAPARLRAAAGTARLARRSGRAALVGARGRRPGRDGGDGRAPARRTGARRARCPLRGAPLARRPGRDADHPLRRARRAGGRPLRGESPCAPTPPTRSRSPR